MSKEQKNDYFKLLKKIWWFFYRKFGVVFLGLMMAVFKPFGYVDPKIWVSDIAMQIYQIIMQIIAFYCIYRLLVSSKHLFLTMRITPTKS